MTAPPRGDPLTPAARFLQRRRRPAERTERELPGFGNDGGAVAVARIERVDRVARGGVGNALRPEYAGVAGRQQINLVRPRRAREALAGRFQEGFLAAPETEEFGLALGRVGQLEKAVDLAGRVEPAGDVVG